MIGFSFKLVVRTKKVVAIYVQIITNLSFTTIFSVISVKHLLGSSLMAIFFVDFLS